MLAVKNLPASFFWSGILIAFKITDAQIPGRKKKTPSLRFLLFVALSSSLLRYETSDTDKRTKIQKPPNVGVLKMYLFQENCKEKYATA